MSADREELRAIARFDQCRAKMDDITNSVDDQFLVAILDKVADCVTRDIVPELSLEEWRIIGPFFALGVGESARRLMNNFDESCGD